MSSVSRFFLAYLQGSARHWWVRAWACQRKKTEPPLHFLLCQLPSAPSHSFLFHFCLLTSRRQQPSYTVVTGAMGESIDCVASGELLACRFPTTTTPAHFHIICVSTRALALRPLPR